MYPAQLGRNQTSRSVWSAWSLLPLFNPATHSRTAQAGTPDWLRHFKKALFTGIIAVPTTLQTQEREQAPRTPYASRGPQRRAFFASGQQIRPLQRKVDNTLRPKKCVSICALTAAHFLAIVPFDDECEAFTFMLHFGSRALLRGRRDSVRRRGAGEQQSRPSRGPSRRHCAEPVQRQTRCLETTGGRFAT